MGRQNRLRMVMDDIRADEEVQGIAIAQIQLPSEQPRKYFDPEKQAELEQSIKEHGILQPLLVRPISSGKYELVAGERRFKAATAVGLNSVPVVVRKFTSEQARTIALVENLQREDLTPLEETEGILALLSHELGGSQEEAVALLRQMSKQEERGDNVVPQEKAKAEEVFQSLGMSWQSFLSHRIPLLNLPDDVLEVLRQGRLKYTKARAIARIKDEAARVELLQNAIEENLSLNEIKERIKALTNKADLSAYKEQIQTTSRKLSKLGKLKLWETNPKKWTKIEKLLNQINELVD